MSPPLHVRPLTVHACLELRHQLLRPQQPPETLIFPGDLDPRSAHFGAFLDAVHVGIATIMPQAPHERVDPSAWRLRAMAVQGALRSQGIGASLLAAALDHARHHSGTWVWCDARIAAVPFYARHGFAIQGPSYEIAGVGPHHFMYRLLGDGSS